MGGALKRALEWEVCLSDPFDCHCFKVTEQYFCGIKFKCDEYILTFLVRYEFLLKAGFL